MAGKSSRPVRGQRVAGRRKVSPGRSGRTRSSRRRRRCALSRAAWRSSRARAPRGTPIRSARRFTSSPVLATVPDRGRTDPGDQARRRRLDSAGRKALAWRLADHGHGPYRDRCSLGWKSRDLDGARHRHGIQRQRRIAGERLSSASARCAVRSRCPSSAPRQGPDPDVAVRWPEPTARLMPLTSVTWMLPASNPARRGHHRIARFHPAIVDTDRNAGAARADRTGRGDLNIPLAVETCRRGGRGDMCRGN